MNGNHVTYAADTISLFAIVGAFAGIFPPLAALGAFIWYAIQVWESKTVQGWLTKSKQAATEKKPLDTP